MNADDHADIVWFEQLGRGDVARVGGKNASLGEMVRNLGEKSVSVPPGFATTADAYWRFLATVWFTSATGAAASDNDMQRFAFLPPGRTP
jgi:pyruvate,water dikinase